MRPSHLLLGAVLATAAALPAPVAAQSGQVLTGEPSAADFIDALAPEMRTRGIKPRDPVAAPEVNLPIITFGHNSAELTPESRRVLDQLALALQSDQLGTFRFAIEGHTDASGPDTYNLQLSERRAEAVSRYLAERNIDPTRLQIVGKGESELYDPEDTLAPINRRVKVVNLGQS